MSGLSLSAALRVPKVSAEYAVNAYTESLSDVCPTWNSQDNYGRQVPYHSYNVLKGGCHNPSARMDIETFLRPNYHPYLNVPGMDQDFVNTGNHGSSFGGYDTMGTRRDEAFGMYRDLETQQRKEPSCNAHDLDHEQMHSMDRNARLFRRVNETNRYRNFTGTY